MPAVDPQQLVAAILSALEESGDSGMLVSPVRQHPRRFIVSAPDGSPISLWVYAWTLTHGGRPSLPREYRIQMTTVSSPLALNPLGPTVLIGYDPSLGVFAGFDLDRHQTFTSGSPSVQIDRSILEKALQDGFAFDRKSNEEIAVGIRPDQFTAYMCNATALHKHGRRPDTLRLLEKASSLLVIPEEEIDALPAERKRIVQTVSRLSRGANFRQQVLYAYGNRCAVTKFQLRLVDAAHILPVGAPGSVDIVSNGIALSPTHHRAYDSGLIYIDESLVMRVNPAKEAALINLQLDGGLADYRSCLGPLLLPPDRRQWPNLKYVKAANRFRLIPGC